MQREWRGTVEERRHDKRRDSYETKGSIFSELFGKLKNTFDDAVKPPSNVPCEYASVYTEEKAVAVRERQSAFDLDYANRTRSACDQPAVQKSRTPLYFIDHPVCPSDTLAGLSLRYNVTRKEIQKHNGRNCIATCNMLKIPSFNPPTSKNVKVKVQTLNAFVEQKKPELSLATSSSEEEPEDEPLIDF